MDEKLKDPFTPAERAFFSPETVPSHHSLSTSSISSLQEEYPFFFDPDNFNMDDYRKAAEEDISEFRAEDVQFWKTMYESSEEKKETDALNSYYWQRELKYRKDIKAMEATFLFKCRKHLTFKLITVLYITLAMCMSLPWYVTLVISSVTAAAHRMLTSFISKGEKYFDDWGKLEDSDSDNFLFSDQRAEKFTPYMGKPLSHY
jgi:hypothetical protein